jgi:tetratricopeptide (TPR) repeat protein
MSKSVREYVPHIPSILSFVSLLLGILSGFTQLLGPHAKWVFALVSAAGAVWLWLARRSSQLAGAPPQPSYPMWLRVGGTAAAVLVAVVSFGPSVRNWWGNQRAPNKVIVVLAKFYDPNGLNVQDDLARGIKAGIGGFEEYAGFVPVDTVLREGTDSADAARFGQKHKATILIWGSCEKADIAGRVTTHFEVLRPPTYMPELSPEARGQPRLTSNMAGLGRFEFNTRVGDEMAATCLMTLGMVHYSAGDYAGAVRPLLAAESTGRAAGLGPFSTAGMEFYLGNVYNALADSVDEAANCRAAITWYTSALAGYTLADSLTDIAKTQSNLGAAYWTLAEVEDKADNCRRAVAACQEALKVCTFDRFPTEYAGAQNNLGSAYNALAEVEDKADNCRLAIAAFQDALKVYTRARFPTDYAMAQINLGNACWVLAEAEDKAENCRRAIAAYQEALRVYTHEGVPTRCAVAQNGLGNAYRTLAEVEDKARNGRLAVAAFQEALKVLTFKRFPMRYAMIQNNLGDAHLARAEAGDKAKNCRLAIAAFQEALRVYTPELFPMQYGTAQNNLGGAYQTLAEVEDKADNCRLAIAACQEALSVHTLDRFPMDYADAQYNLGNAYRTLAEVEDKAENCRLAMTAYEEALTVFTTDKLPVPHEIVTQSLHELRKWMGQF